MTRRLLPVVLLLVFALSAALLAAPAPETPQNVILISWDGVQRDHFNDMREADRLPNLTALAKQGTLVNIDVVGHQSDTKAGHTQMLTGYEPEVTGVYNNGNFKPIPEGYTIFERLQQRFGKDKIATIMLTGKTHHIGGEGPGVLKPAKGDQPEKRHEGEPFYLTKTKLDVWDSNGAPANVVGPKMMGYLDQFKERRYFAFFHFSDPDSKGHKFGENSPEYEQAIVTCDEWLGKMVTRLKAQGLYDKTLIYVTSDHGFDEDKTTHKDAPFIWLATNDTQVVRAGDQRDIVPTILTRFGVDITKIDPPYPGKLLTEKAAEAALAR